MASSIFVFFGQNCIVLENNKENRHIFDANLPGSLINILQNNHPALNRFCSSKTDLMLLDPKSVEEFGMDLSEFEKINMRMPFCINTPFFYEEYLGRPNENIPFHIWVASLLKEKYDNQTSIFAELEYWIERDSMYLKKAFMSADLGGQLYHTWQNYYSVKNIDFIAIEPKDNETMLYFYRRTPKGNVCTLSIPLSFLWRELSLGTNYPHRITKQVIKAAKKERLTAYNANKKSLNKIMDIDDYFIEEFEEPIVNYNSPGLNRNLIKTIDSFPWIIDNLGVKSPLFKSNMNIPRFDRFDDWISFLINDPVNYVTLEDGFYFNPFQEIEEWDSTLRVQLKKAWNEAEYGDVLTKTREIKIWVDPIKPMIKVKGRFGTTNPIFQSIYRIDTIFNSGNDSNYSLRFFNAQNVEIDTLGAHKLNQPAFFVQKMFILDELDGHVYSTMAFSAENETMYKTIEKTLANNPYMEKVAYVYDSWVRTITRFIPKPIESINFKN
jgi:hypothetical protein